MILSVFFQLIPIPQKSTHNKGKNELATQNGTVQRWYGPPENELSSVVAIQCSSCYLMHGCKPKREWMRQLRHRSSRPLAMRQIHRNWIGIFGQVTSPQRTQGKVSLCFASDRSEQVESKRHVVKKSSRHVAIDLFKQILEFQKVGRSQLHLWRKLVSLKAKMYLWRWRCIYEGKMYSWRGRCIYEGEDVFMRGKMYLWSKDVFMKGKMYLWSKDVFMKRKMYLWRGICIYEGEDVLMKGKMYLWRGRCIYEGEYVFTKGKM